MTAAVDGAAQMLAPTNLLALFALGLALGQNVAWLPRTSLIAFAVGLVAGSVLIALAVGVRQIPLIPLALAAAARMIGVIARPIPPMLKVTLSLASGAVLALNAPPQAITIPAAIAAQFARGMAALAIVSLVTLIATKATRNWQRIGLRIAASWITASAILVLALRLAR